MQTRARARLLVSVSHVTTFIIAKTRSKLKSRKDILSPSEQLRRGRYEHHDDTYVDACQLPLIDCRSLCCREVYVNLLQLREEIAISSRRASYDDEIDDENEPYETDLEHLQDVRNAVKHLRAVPVFMKNKLEILQYDLLSCLTVLASVC